MTTSEPPEADALEQQRLLVPDEPDELEAELDPEVNAADALEQRRVAEDPEDEEDYTR